MKARKHIAGNKIEERKFARAIVSNGGNATQAVLDTGKKIKRASARTRGKDLLKRESVREEIEKALKDSGVSFKYVLDARKEVVEQGKRHLDGRRRDKELLVTPKDMHSHLQGIESIMLRTADKGNLSNKSKHLHLHLEEKSQKELLEKRQELSSWFTDVIEGDQ